MKSTGSTQPIGLRVKQRRSDLGLSQRELAKLAGTTAAAVSHIERSQRRPSADLLGRLAGALECSTDELMPGAPGLNDEESICLARVTSAMKTFPAAVQEEVADYCDFLKTRRAKR